MNRPADSIDTALRERARKVIPGGLWGHQNAASLPDGYPQFFSRAEGCRLFDVDGREYIDFMMSWGPVVLGHRHAAVDAAVQAQMAQGSCMNGPGKALVELAERLVDLVPHADWAMFQKNGTDATTGAVTIARAATRRRKILVARGSYHGAAPWCTPSLAGVTAEDRAHIAHFDYNDVASLEAAADSTRGDLAAILVTAFRHDLGRDQEMPARAFAEAARRICDTSEAALVIDDVRAGFRLHMGGSWETLGVRPDLSAFSKAIANGFPLAAITGGERFREAATRIFVTGSFWCEAPPMAAALATLQALQEGQAIARMETMGGRLRHGLGAAAARHGVRIRQTGPVQMPLLLFEDDPTFARGFAFCATALARGAYFHPKHTMFLSAAHSEHDIDEALEAADEGFAAVARMGSAPRATA